MVLRHHTVLAPLSRSYSVPLGRFPRVTHPCATKAEAFVRLACVRHAASVRSEPESNSQVFERPIGHGGKPAPRRPLSRSRSCTNTWCVLGHEEPPKRASLETSVERHNLPSTRRLKTVGPGAAAHMSLHQTDNEKERTAQPTPFLPPCYQGRRSDADVAVNRVSLLAKRR